MAWNSLLHEPREVIRGQQWLSNIWCLDDLCPVKGCKSDLKSDKYSMVCHDMKGSALAHGLLLSFVCCFHDNMKL